MLTWQWTRFAGLSGDDVYDMLALRSTIFVVEQDCVYLDPDGLDRQSWHLLGRDEHGELLAYVRVCDPGVKYAPPSIGRVVVNPSQRGTGLGHVLIAEALKRCDETYPGPGPVLPAEPLKRGEETYPGAPNRIGAQAHLQVFYGRHGYLPVGETYL